MDIQEEAAPRSTLLGRKVVIVLLLVWWSASYVMSHLVLPHIEPYLAALSEKSTSEPTEEELWAAERDQLSS